MINIGDRVKFVSDTGVGIVRSINKGIAMVDVDGFEIPVQVNEIVAAPIEDEQNARKQIAPVEISNVPRHKSKTENSFGKIAFEDDFEDEPIDVAAMKRQFAATQKALVSDQDIVVKPQLAPFQESDYLVKLMFVPNKTDVAPQDSDLDLYLVNDSSYNVSYSVALFEKQGYVTVLGNGCLEDDEKVLISTFKRNQLNNVANLHISLMPFKELNYTPWDASSCNVELHPLKFVHEKNYVENDYFDQHVISFTLADFKKQ